MVGSGPTVWEPTNLHAQDARHVTSYATFCVTLLEWMATANWEARGSKGKQGEGRGQHTIRCIFSEIFLMGQEIPFFLTPWLFRKRTIPTERTPRPAS
jgi:hypothetical protein